MDHKLMVYASILPVAQDAVSAGAFTSFTVPPEELRQKDLQYITAILVSSGMNLNGAVFLPSELIQARNSIRSKPLDIEHIEGAVVGHIYDHAFMLPEGSVIDPQEFMLEKGTALDRENIDIAVAMALYKYRFADVAEDVVAGKYKVSMECYYRDFDIKVGDIIISKDEATAIGIKWEGPSSMVGRSAKIRYNGKEVAIEKVGRVLRGIMFSGAGLVDSPANLRSVIREAAAATAEDRPDVAIDVEGSPTLSEHFRGAAGLSPHSINPGLCVSFKHRVTRYVQPSQNLEGDRDPSILNPPGVQDTTSQDDVIIHENWCMLFDVACTSRPGDATQPECLRNMVPEYVREQLSVSARLAPIRDYLLSKNISLSEDNEVVLERLRRAINEASFFVNK